MRWLGGKLLLQCIGASAWIALQGVSVVSAADTSFNKEVAKALQTLKDAGHSRPILDTHIHFYQASRPGGIPCPPAKTEFFGDELPPASKNFPTPNGFTASALFERGPRVEVNRWAFNLW